MTQRKEIDLLNGPIRLARELGYLMVRQFLEQQPRAIGQAPEGDVQGRVSLDQLKRLRGE